MDRRGLTTDPNASGTGDKKWWENLGPTQHPSPYATASWRYYQDYIVDIVEIPAAGAVVYDNGADFTKPVYPLSGTVVTSTPQFHHKLFWTAAASTLLEK